MKPKSRPEVEFRTHLRARATLVWIVSHEERVVETAITAQAAKEGFQVRFWDAADGAKDAEGAAIELAPGAPGAGGPGQVLARIKNRKEIFRQAAQKKAAEAATAIPPGSFAAVEPEALRELWILRDFHKWLSNPGIERSLRSLARELQEVVEPELMAAVVVLCPSSEVPETLKNATTVMDWPLPDRAMLEKVLDQAMSCPGTEIVGPREAVLDALAGLSVDHAGSAIALSMAKSGGKKPKIDPAILSGEKERIINSVPGLTWHPPIEEGLNAIGGLELLKEWLEERKLGLGEKAREFGLPTPRGVLLVGLSGCGKSLSAKALPAAWGGLPLIRMDVGAFRSSLVGSSEARLRNALKILESVGKCVVWLDEIEKALGSNNGTLDGGVGSDALGTILTWLQDREGQTFVVATANDVSALPVELTRKGRVDEIFFVDLPTSNGRREVLLASLRKARARRIANGGSPAGLEPGRFDLDQVVRATPDFTGAEIESLVDAGLFRALSKGRELETSDLVEAARQTKPMARLATAKLTALREWAKDKARDASRPEVAEKPQAQTAVGASRFALTLAPDEEE